MEVSALTHAGAAGHARSPLLRLQSDERLIALIRRGNHHAFEALVARYQARLLAFCRHMLSSREDAEDVLQEVFAAAFNAINADNRAINVRPWLYRIARNRSLNHLRKAQAIGVDSMDVHLSEHGITTADKVHKREEFRQLMSDVQDLPETQRTALLLREIDALSYDQIAEAMETTVPSVKSLLVRARVSLAEAAEARLLTCEEVRDELGEVAEGLRRTTPPVRRHLRTCDRCQLFRSSCARRTRRSPRSSRSARSCCSRRRCSRTPARPPRAAAARPRAASAAAAGAAGAAGAAAGGALQAGAGALASKAVAGLAAAAIVTAGAVEVKHVKDRPGRGKAAAAQTAKAPAAAAAPRPSPSRSRSPRRRSRSPTPVAAPEPATKQRKAEAPARREGQGHPDAHARPGGHGRPRRLARADDRARRAAERRAARGRHGHAPGRPGRRPGADPDRLAAAADADAAARGDARPHPAARDDAGPHAGADGPAGALAGPRPRPSGAARRAGPASRARTRASGPSSRAPSARRPRRRGR